MSILCDQLEEGEIVDDDFSEISDNSIINDHPFGKFPSPSEKLPALSLSSSSDNEIFKIKHKKHPSRRCHRHKHIKTVQAPPKRRRHSSSSTENEFSSLSDCNSIKEKLKEAVHISGLNIGEKKTLESRLKAMGADFLPSTSPILTPDASPRPVEMPDDFDRTDDKELENLRIEALKTAMLNKYQQRKKKKELLQKPEVLNNKENNTPDNIDEMEEDEDVLRASLLAGLAQKLTEIQPAAPEAVPIAPKPAPAALPPIFTKIVNKPVAKKTVKPLIIKLNSDTSDDDEFSVQRPKNGTDINAISSTVEQFLKEQRAKFENEAEKSANQSQNVLEKSAVKLLPKSQQIEYQQLLRKIKNAEKTMKMKQLQQKQMAVQKKRMEEAAGKRKLEVARKKLAETVEEDNVEVKRKNVLTNELTALKNTLKEIRTLKNGSLQIKPKYQVLTTIMKQINETSHERRKHEARIKALEQQINESKGHLKKSHETFSTLVNELLVKKQEIDKSCEVGIAKLKLSKIVKAENEKKILGEKIEADKKFLITSTPLKLQVKSTSSIEDCTISTLANTELEDMDVCNSDETDQCQIEIVDPNDIDQIYKRKPQKETIPEYISPLNNCNRYISSDPLGVICPYEMNGSCRDVECTFKHYLKK